MHFDVLNKLVLEATQSDNKSIESINFAIYRLISRGNTRLGEKLSGIIGTIDILIRLTVQKEI